MLTEVFDVNILGPVLPLFYHRTDISLQIRCAKMFGALKNSANALKEYYEHASMPQSLVDTRFPWITQYNIITKPTEICEYKYLSRMDRRSLVYICQHICDKKQILVKFVQTYSKDAHLASAANGGAPTLLGHSDILSCGWSVVVMELLEEPEWVPGLDIWEKSEQHMVREKVREHVLTLHRQGFVHGDIRPQNVLVRRPVAGYGPLSVRLIDFDWAGEINKAKYTFLVNPDLGYGFKRPSGVKGGGIITPAHDLAMVGLMYLPVDPS
jgi:serine/threonine protein kinase